MTVAATRDALATAAATPGIAISATSTTRAQVGESPLWSPAEACVWWVDIEGRTLHRHRPGDGSDASWRTDERLACIALHAGGGLVAAMESGIFHLRPGADGALGCERIASVQHPHPGMRFNDGRCDREGRFWVTSMVRDMSLGAAAGALYRVDENGLSAPLVDGLVTGNGLAFSPDGATLYLSDSHPTVRHVWRFDLDAGGTPGNRRLFVDMNRHPGRPDGAAVDARGRYWTAANDAGRLLCFTPEGELEREIALPVSKPSMPAFGGVALDLLFVTSIVPAAPASGFDGALDGALLTLDAGAHGIAETPFGP